MNYLLNDLLVAVYNHSTFGVKSGKSTIALQDIIEKRLWALEIIKEKRVDTRALIEILEDEWTWEQYMDEEDDINTGGHQFSRDRLTKEEYEVLKGALL